MSLSFILHSTETKQNKMRNNKWHSISKGLVLLLFVFCLKITNTKRVLSLREVRGTHLHDFYSSFSTSFVKVFLILYVALVVCGVCKHLTARAGESVLSARYSSVAKDTLSDKGICRGTWDCLELSVEGLKTEAGLGSLPSVKEADGPGEAVVGVWTE